MSKPKFLSDSKMRQIVPRLFGKSELAVKDGKVELNDEERNAVRANFGDAFLSKLENTVFDSEAGTDSSRELFDKISELQKKLAEKDELTAKLQEQVLKLASEPETAKTAEPVAISAAPKFKLDMAARHNILAHAALADPAKAFASNMAASSIDVTDLNAEFTKAMPPKLRLDIVSQRIYAGFTDSKYMTRVQSNTDYISSVSLMSEVSQQFTSEWTPKGAAKFTPSRIPYRRHKINVNIKPADIIPSWLGYLYEQGKTLSDMPITLYIINQMILPKLQEDITLAMIGKGKFQDAGTVAEGDEGKPAADSMDGYETLLVSGKSDSSCKFNYYKAAKNPLTLSDSELLEYVQGFVDAISPLFASRMNVFCSQELLTKYQRADYAVNGKYTGQTIDGKVRFTNFSLVPLDGMYNSQILFATPKENFVELVDYSNAQNCIQKVRETDYGVHIIGEYSLSVGFKVQEAVYAAVPDGYDPAAAVISGPDGYSSAWQHGGDSASSDSSSENEGA